MSNATTTQENNIKLVQTFFDLLEKRDIFAITEIASPELVWHQPGKNRFSGSHRGLIEVGMMVAGMIAMTQDNLEITVEGPMTAENDLVRAKVTLTAEAKGLSLTRTGMDTFKVENGIIVEAWSESDNQSEIDNFWAEVSATPAAAPM